MKREEWWALGSPPRGVLTYKRLVGRHTTRVYLGVEREAYHPGTPQGIHREAYTHPGTPQGIQGGIYTPGYTSGCRKGDICTQGIPQGVEREAKRLPRTSFNGVIPAKRLPRASLNGVIPAKRLPRASQDSYSC